MTIRFPWPTLRQELRLTVHGLFLDDEDRSAELVDAEHLRFQLDGSTEWDSLRLSVSVDPDVLSAVPGAQAHAVVDCTPTNVRIPFPLDIATGSGEIVLDRDEIAERFSLEVEATALVRGRRRNVGGGPSWTGVVDRGSAPVPPGAPPFETVWLDFRDATAPATVRGTPDATAYMDLQGEPRLLLNTAVDGFQHLLHADTAKLERRRLRELLGSDVARYALTCLFRAAAAEVLTEDGVVRPPEQAVYRQVCEAVAEQMPGIGSVDELYDRVLAARESVTVSHGLWGGADLAIAALSGRDHALATACSEVKHA